MGNRGSSTLDPWLCNYSENLHIFHSQNPRKLSNKPQRVLCHNHFLTEAFSLTSAWHFNDSIFDPHSNSANWPLLLSSFWIGRYLKIKSHFNVLDLLNDRVCIYPGLCEDKHCLRVGISGHLTKELVLNCMPSPVNVLWNQVHTSHVKEMLRTRAHREKLPQINISSA